MLDPDAWSGTSIGSIPIGQGIAVTAMQMLFAFNTIANDGVYVPPRVVLAEVDEHGDRHPLDVPDQRRVVSELTADQMRTMLGLVVAEGTGTNAQVDGYPVAGKTGTARKPQPGGGYEDAAGNFQYVATFVGFAPVEHPELSIIVVLDEPSSTIFGGSASAPLFADLARYGLRQLQIPPVCLGRPRRSGRGARQGQSAARRNQRGACCRHRGHGRFACRPVGHDDDHHHRTRCSVRTRLKPCVSVDLLDGLSDVELRLAGTVGDPDVIDVVQHSSRVGRGRDVLLRTWEP